MNFIRINGIPIYKTGYIIKQVDYAINKQKPFSFVRFGDGTIKAIHAFLEKDYDQLLAISQQEGIPFNQFEQFINFWAKSANLCDYVDSPEIYFSPKFWNRTRGLSQKRMSDKTIDRLHYWEDLYKQIGIINTKYCNPEVNFLMCLNDFQKKSLSTMLTDKKICCIASRDDVQIKLKEYKIDVIKIANKFENHFKQSFNYVIDNIVKKSKDYDIWLIAAGELGRIYPGLIKFEGGRAIDVGSVIDFWCGEELPSRLKPYIQQSKTNPLDVELTNIGKEFFRFL